MAVLNMDYYVPTDDDVYSDGSIESVIYNRVKEHRLEVGPEDEWAVVYHLSPLRHNILNWYPFREGCSILEIGAGCGALTGLLARRAGKLVSVELTRIRANIAFERNRDQDNLEVIVGDINRLKFSEKFDYIICNGVLEYAGLMIRGNDQNPGFELLRLMRGWLKDDGILLLAIENRLGLKYFAGSKEDHVGKAYAGIDGYKETRSIRTYSREELRALCEKAGLVYQKWYFPFPDYKFPLEIFTDSSVNDRLPGVRDVPLDADQVHVFDEERVYVDLMEQQAMQSMSNSFLVEASASELPAASQSIGYVELKYQCRAEAACRHIWNLKDRILTVTEGSELQRNSEAPAVRIPEGESLFRLLQKNRFSRDEVRKQLDGVRDQLYAAAAAADRKAFGELLGEVSEEEVHWVDGRWLDADARNLYTELGAWKLLVSQSQVSIPVPAELVLWRLAQGLKKDYRLETVLTDEMVCDWLGVSEIFLKGCGQMEQRYEHEVLGKTELRGRRLDHLDVEVSGRKLIAARQQQAEIRNLAQQGHDELYALAGLKSYRIAYAIYRFRNDFMKGGREQRKHFLRWLKGQFGRREVHTEGENPMLRIADSLISDSKQ